MQRLPTAVIVEALVPGRTAERARLRLDVGRLLGRADLRPRGAAPSEILLVQRLSANADPAAPGLMLRHGEAEGMTARISALRRRAARPIGGQIPASAEAVLFLDTAELAACLLLARVQGRPTQAWWYRAAGRFAGDVLRAPSLGSALCTRATLLPAIVETLDRWGATETVFAALTAGELRPVAGELIDAFCPTSGMPPSRPADLRPAPQALATTVPQAAAPATRLGLVAALRALRRQPALARDRGFRQWLAVLADSTAQLGDHGAGQTPDEPQQRVPVPPRTRQPNAPTPPTSGSSLPTPTGEDARPDPAGSKARRRDTVAPEWRSGRAAKPTITQASVSLPLTPAPPPSTAPAAPAEPTISDEPSSEEVEARVVVPGAAAVTAMPDEPDQPYGWADLPATPTRIGGVFYLWRFIVALGLPDAAADWGMPGALEGWALLEAVARVVLGAADDFASDPLWSLLARLDGRAADPLVGTGMIVPPTASAALSADNAAGTWDPSPALAQWMAASAPTLTTELATVLDVPPAQATQFLRLDAEVHVSATHVDVIAGLADATTPVRRAGLDIDPGWVPALGRVLLFHYL